MPRPQPPADTPSSAPRRSQGKRAAILRGAMEEFLGHGYAATSMDRIAAAAAVSKATVYAHFANKDSLFQALTAHLVEERFTRLFGSSAAEALPPEPRQALAELAHRLLTIDRQQPDFLAFLRLVIGESGRFPQLGPIFVERVHQIAFRQVSQLFAALAESAPRGGGGPERDPELLARIFIGSLAHLLIVQDLMHGREVVAVDRERFAAGLVEQLSR